MQTQREAAGAAELFLGRLFGRGGPGRTTPGSLWQKVGMPLALLTVAVYFAISSSIFLTRGNLFSIGLQAAVTAIAAIGASFVFVSGGIDISQGAVMAFAGLTVVYALDGTGLPDIVCIVLGLLVGLSFGAANGALAEIVGIPAFIATLGTGLVIRGGAYAWTEGISSGLDPGRGKLFSWIGQGYIGRVPVALLLALILYAIAALALRKTVWGRHTYAIGGNAEAARVSGINVRRHRIQVYAVAGAFSAAAGIVLSARLGSAAPDTATGAEFDVITAVVLGGVSIFGGSGRVLRVFVAAVFLSTLNDGMVLTNVPTYYQRIVTGGVFLAALALDQLGARRR
jgi:ribose transport system permease protein